jgi:hypothetical protein
MAAKCSSSDGNIQHALSRCNIALAIQCEGNGHFTQAISISKSLHAHLGLKIKCVFLNEAKRHTIPKHFYDAFPNVPCLFTEGPVLIRSNKNQALDKFATTANILGRMLGSYQNSLKFISNHIKEYNINVVINLYDVMLVWYLMQYKPANLHVINVGTQFKWDVQYYHLYEHSKQVCLHNMHGMLYHAWKAAVKTEMGLYNNFHSPHPIANLSYTTVALSPYQPLIDEASSHASAGVAASSMPENQPANRFGPLQTFLLPAFALPFKLPFLNYASAVYDVVRNVRFSHVAPTEETLMKIQKKRHAVYDMLPMIPKEASFYVTPCFVSYIELQAMLLPNIAEFVPNWLSVKSNAQTLLICGYINNTGFFNEIFQFCLRTLKNNGNVATFHIFLFMRQDLPIEFQLPNLTTLQVDRSRFVTMLHACDGLMCTAGVEAVCEAIAFQKPAFIVPNTNDSEQSFNAILFVEHMNGVLARTNFDLTDFFAYLHNPVAIKTHQDECLQVRAWMEQASHMFAYTFRDIVLSSSSLKLVKETF